MSGATRTRRPASSSNASGERRRRRGVGREDGQFPMVEVHEIHGEPRPVRGARKHVDAAARAHRALRVLQDPAVHHGENRPVHAHALGEVGQRLRPTPSVPGLTAVRTPNSRASARRASEMSKTIASAPGPGSPARSAVPSRRPPPRRSGRPEGTWDRSTARTAQARGSVKDASSYVMLIGKAEGHPLHVRPRNPDQLGKAARVDVGGFELPAHGLVAVPAGPAGAAGDVMGGRDAIPGGEAGHPRTHRPDHPGKFVAEPHPLRNPAAGPASPDRCRTGRKPASPAESRRARWPAAATSAQTEAAGGKGENGLHGSARPRAPIRRRATGRARGGAVVSARHPVRSPVRAGTGRSGTGVRSERA